MARTPAVVNVFNQHAPPVTVAGRSYVFRTAAGAEKFAALVGQRQKGVATVYTPELPRCFASDVHLSAIARLAATPIPECVRREALKARLALDRARRVAAAPAACSCRGMTGRLKGQLFDLDAPFRALLSIGVSVYANRRMGGM